MSKTDKIMHRVSRSVKSSPVYEPLSITGGGGGMMLSCLAKGKGTKWIPKSRNKEGLILLQEQ